jgi:hypothetical protein
MEIQSLPPAPPNFTQPSAGRGSSPKSLPAPVRMLIRPMLFIALGFHALLLFTPLPAEQKPKPPEDKKNPVKITQVPTVKPVKTTQTAQTPKISNRNQPKIDRAVPSAALPQPDDKPEENRTTPEKQEIKSPKSPDDPFVGFPHYPSSKPDCFDKGLGASCRTTDASIATVAAFYKTELPKQKFTITIVEDGSGKQIYQVSKEDKTRYLHFFDDSPNTVILLADEKNDLQGLKGAIVLPSEYVDLVGSDLPASDPNDPTTAPRYEEFENPKLFYREITKEELDQGNIPELLPSIGATPRVVRGQLPQSVYASYLQDNLKNIFKVVTLEGSYGGGPLYKLKNDKVTVFLNLVPTRDGSGTIVVSWIKDPKSGK